MVIKCSSGVITIETSSYDGWQDGDQPANGRAIEAAVDCLTSAFGVGLPYDLVLGYRPESPITVARDGLSPKAPTRIGLSVESLSLWNQLIYQLAHEVFHVLSNCDRSWGVIKQSQWVEEALAESASIFVLRSLDRDWRQSSHQDWSNQARVSLSMYAEANHLINYTEATEAEYQTDDLPSYFSAWRDKLEADPYIKDGPARACNRLPGYLTPILMDEPQLWQDCRHLNLWDDLDDDPVEVYLDKWQRYGSDQSNQVRLPSIIRGLLAI